MKPEVASKTADSSAAQRAFHFLHDRAPKVFSDPFALHLTSPMWRRVVEPSWLARLVIRNLYRWGRPILAEHLARARYVDEGLEAAVGAGARQFVILGAGMDSFALRRPDLCERMQVFEVDHPATQKIKRGRVEQAGFRPPPGHHYVPVDFARDSLKEQLRSSGFSDSGPAFFGWMGVTPYLGKNDIAATFGDIAEISAGRTEVAFDFLEADVFSEGAADGTSRKLLRFAARRGEPITTAFEVEELRTFLAGVGFELIEVVSPDDQQRRWFDGRSDDLAPYRYGYLARARVVG